MKTKSAVSGLVDNGVCHDALYAPGIFYNLNLVSKVQRNNFQGVVNVGMENSRRGERELVYKPSSEAKLVGTETSERLYQAVLRVKTGERAHIASGHVKHL